MIFNENGFPRPTGATDFLDSAHLAGLMAFVGHEKMPRIRLQLYTKWSVETGHVLMRCPGDNSGLDATNYKNCSRDQLICYLAGLKNLNAVLLCDALYSAAKERGYRAQNTERDVPSSTKKFPDGPDILDPSHIGYMKICAGLSANWFEKFWMRCRIRIASRFSPMKEPNNIVVMSIIYGYADLLKKCNPKINDAIREYWGNWRNEPELAEMIIIKLEQACEQEKT